MKIQIVAEKILGVDGALADVVAIGGGRRLFGQFYILGPYRYDHRGVLAHTLARVRLELAHGRADDAAAIAERGDGAADEIGGADEVGDELIRRLLVDLARRADLDDAAFIHHRDLVRKRKRLGLVVRDVDGREIEVALQPLELGAHAVAQLGVEVGERLVEQQELRLHHQGAREREPLLLAAGELGGVAIDQLLERDRVQHAHDLVADVLLGEPAHLQRKRHVLEDVHVRPDGVGLEHHAEIALVRRDENALVRRIDEPAGDLDLARNRLLQPGDRAQRRGLAAARRPEQREQFALRHLERDVLRGFDRATALVGVFGEERSYAEHVSIPRILCFRNSEPPAGELRQHDHQEQRDDQHHAERRKLHVLPILP